MGWPADTRNSGHTFHDLIGANFQQDVDLQKLYMDAAAYSDKNEPPMPGQKLSQGVHFAESVERFS